VRTGVQQASSPENGIPRFTGLYSETLKIPRVNHNSLRDPRC